MSEQQTAEQRQCCGRRFGHDPADCPNKAKWLAVLPGHYDRYVGVEHPGMWRCVAGHPWHLRYGDALPSPQASVGQYPAGGGEEPWLAKRTSSRW